MPIDTLHRAHVEIRPTDPDDRAALQCLAAYFQLLTDKAVTRETFPLPDPDAYKYRPPHGTFLIAFSHTLPIGCVSLRTLDPGLGEVKRLWVAPDVRGQGLARRLMTAVENAARALNLHHLNLDTNAALPEAIALYHATGWHPIPAYSGFPSTHWFGKRL
ncbi:MAG: GNAT family N-acetyltransferase [Paracoccaceae bacterium]